MAAANVSVDRNNLERFAIRDAFLEEDAGVYGCRDSGDSGRDRREHGRIFCHQYSPAETADVSRSAVHGSTDEYQPAGKLSGRERAQVQRLAAADKNLSASGGLRFWWRWNEFDGRRSTAAGAGDSCVGGIFRAVRRSCSCGANVHVGGRQSRMVATWWF